MCDMPPYMKRKTIKRKKKEKKKDGKTKVIPKLAALIATLTDARLTTTAAISHSGTESGKGAAVKHVALWSSAEQIFRRGADTGISCKSSLFPHKSPRLCTSCQDAGVGMSALPACRAAPAVWTPATLQT